MRKISTRRSTQIMLAMLIAPLAAGASAQTGTPSDNIVVNGVQEDMGPMTAGPEIKGVISARHGAKMKVTTADGSSRIIAITDATRIKAGSGLFSGSRAKLASDSLLNGLPVDSINKVSVLDPYFYV